MTDLRTAAQQALAALEYDNPAGRSATIRALRAALAQEQAESVQMHPSQFAELIKGKETMIGVPVYWSEWPTKETQ